MKGFDAVIVGAQSGSPSPDAVREPSAARLSIARAGTVVADRPGMTMPIRELFHAVARWRMRRIAARRLRRMFPAILACASAEPTSRSGPRAMRSNGGHR